MDKTNDPVVWSLSEEECWDLLERRELGRLALGLVLAVCESFLRRLAIHLVPRVVSTVSLRPDHASGLEDIHSIDAGVAGGDCGLDANALEHLEQIVDGRRPGIFR